MLSDISLGRNQALLYICIEELSDVVQGMYSGLRAFTALTLVVYQTLLWRLNVEELPPTKTQRCLLNKINENFCVFFFSK